MRKAIAALLLAAWMSTAAAAFEVEDIRIEGLQRIAAGTVFNYLPIQVGDTVGEERISAAIKALYETGFFQDVTLARDGETLVVEVVERPAVARIEIFGNEQLEDEELRQGLRDSGLAEGRTFNRSLLTEIERALQEQYFALGYYDVGVESTVSPLPRNRVSVRLDVTEREPAAVQKVNIVGNAAFSDERLREEFQLGPRSWWAFLSTRDRYSRQKLTADLEGLRSFYLDRGYINFEITSTQVSISPDRRRISITVNVDEGDQYVIDGIDLAGELIFPAEELRSLLTVQREEVFSRQRITESADALRNKLGERGYAFANVNPVPEVDEEAGTVDVTFFVDPAERVYVRRINISGNERTRDEVVRRELTQLEGAPLSTERLQESREALGRLGFFGNVEIDTPRVPGARDQVDVDVSVEERLSGALQVGAGFGSEQGLLVNASVEQDNVFGSGDRAQFTANNSRINTIYRASYLDRFYTKEGIDRNLALSYRRTDAAEADLSDYDIRSLTGTYGYRIPITQYDTLGFDLEYEDLTIELGDDTAQLQRDFVEQYGDQNRILRTNFSWTRDSRNRAVFPDRGSRQRLALDIAVPVADLEYYRATYRHDRYLGLTERTTLKLDGSIGYGDGYGDTDRLPFFENFFAGGIDTVRGYAQNSLGRRDENGDPTGGNVRALASAELLFVPPWQTDVDGSLRLGWFVDAGQVWDTKEEDVDFGNVRYSTGFSLSWYSPVGPLTISVGKPLNEGPTDEERVFQFSLGASF